MKKRILAVLTAAVFVLLSVCSALPALAKTEKPAVKYDTPAGYNDHDYQKLVAFLETEDEDGVKNGEKLSEDYDPADPETWDGVEWDQGRAIRFKFVYRDLVGDLDLSGCAALILLDCIHNALTELDVSGCAALNALNCDWNELTELDVSANTELSHLNCSNNALTELDVSTNTELWDLYCSGNALTELDLSNNPNLFFNAIRAEGSGTIGHNILLGYDEFFNDIMYTAAVAQPDPGSEFLGWYTEEGELISTELELDERNTEYTRVVARFGDEPDPIPGDCDGSGAVDTTDALYVLRCALGISGNEEEMLANCDMDGNGVIDTTDALLVLRLALGIGQ